MSANNKCGQVGSTFAGVTTAIAPSVLSTVRSDHKTYSFNFDDLSCPPPEVGWNPANGHYRPQVAPGDFLWDLDPAFKNCTPGYLTGIDPFKPLLGKHNESPAGGNGHHGLAPPQILAVNLAANEDPHSSPDDPFQYFPGLVQPKRLQKLHRRAPEPPQLRAEENTIKTIELDPVVKDVRNLLTEEL